MRWLAAALGFVLLAAFLALGVATIATIRHADPMLWPARPGEPTVEIAVVSNGYHTGIAIPRATLAEYAGGRGYPALLAVAQRFNQFPFIEFGWGEESFYRNVPKIGDLTLSLALRALFLPGNKSVLHVVGLPGEPARVFPSAEIVPIALSRNGFDQLLQKLDATFVPPQNGALPDSGRGLYGPSLFYPANGTFSFMRVCNHWIAGLLGAAGLPVTPVLDTFATGLILDLRWRAGLKPAVRP